MEKLLTTSIPTWGSPGCPLLPATLRKKWETTPLPQWLSEEIGLAAGARVTDLGSRVWDSLYGHAPT